MDILPTMDGVLFHSEQAKVQYASKAGRHFLLILINGWVVWTTMCISHMDPDMFTIIHQMADTMYSLRL